MHLIFFSDYHLPPPPETLWLRNQLDKVFKDRLTFLYKEPGGGRVVLQLDPRGNGSGISLRDQSMHVHAHDSDQRRQGMMTLCRIPVSDSHGKNDEF